MFRNFSGQTADEVWLAAAGAFRPTANTGVSSAQPSRAGPTQEILHATLSVAEPRQRWVVSRVPPINPAFAIAEVVWILAGRNDSAFLNYFNRSLPQYAGSGPVYHGAYGHRLRRHFGIDQLDRAYKALQANTESRQVVLQIWDVVGDSPDDSGKAVSEDIPCNVLSMLKVRSGALHWTQVMRSNDVFRGLPNNFVQFTTLQEVVAGWLGLELGSYDHVSDSLHVYDTDLAAVLNSTPMVSVRNVDSLALPRSESDVAFAELAARADQLTRDEVSADQCLRNVLESSLPEAHRNMLCVLCAEGARRRRETRTAKQIMQACSNPVYRQLFGRWIERLPS